MTLKTLSESDIRELIRAGTEALADLPQQRRIAAIAMGGKAYRAVRTSGGIQIQSADKRTLIAECAASNPSVTRNARARVAGFGLGVAS